jgi:hypothetical protein
LDEAVRYGARSVACLILREAAKIADGTRPAEIQQAG